ncbi:MAG: hypothetical protein AB2L12_11500 [Smithellaceae bacterium]
MKLDDSYLDDALRQIGIINEQRRQWLASLRKALLENDERGIIQYSKQLCGLGDESNRISTGINPGTGE